MNVPRRVQSKCQSITLQRIGQLECDKTERVQIEDIWYIYDNQDQCESKLSSTRLTLKENLPSTCDHSSLCIRLYQEIHKYLIIRFRSKDCLSIRNGNTVRTTCLITSIIGIANSDFSCRAELPSERYITYGETICENSSKCSIPNFESYDNIADIYFHCKGDPNYAAIAGGIVGGVLLIIFIIVGVFLLRGHICITSNKEQAMTYSNQTNDPSHDETEPENHQQVHFLNSPDAIHVSTSHAVNVVNTPFEESNTYSDLRNTMGDSDVMYDHTIRHNIHDTCDGDYGIAHRKITEDDYDVSGNYRTSISKEIDPVYN